MTKYYYDPNMNRGYIPGRYVNRLFVKFGAWRKIGNKI